jgi:pilus assembly protein Flp/PilA
VLSSVSVLNFHEAFDKFIKKGMGKEVRIMYLPREEGQGLVEYALILVLVAIVVIAILTLLGPQIANTFSKVTNGLATS